jgi:membrane protein implicated in regulation of membrane protease activity
MTFALALLSMVVPAARYLNAAIAALLVALTLWLAPRSPLTYWSNGFAAIAVLALSLFDRPRLRPRVNAPSRPGAPSQRTST